jgi:hypothetical protein
MSTHALPLRQANITRRTARIARVVRVRADRRPARTAGVPHDPPAADMSTAIYRLAPRV